MPIEIYSRLLDNGGSSAGIQTTNGCAYVRDVPERAIAGIRSFIEVSLPDDPPITWPVICSVIDRAYQIIGPPNHGQTYIQDLPDGARLDLLVREGGPATPEIAKQMIREALQRVAQLRLPISDK